MAYPGAKSSTTAYPQIIGHIPPHQIMIEAYAGSAAITRKIRPAEKNYAIDIDPDAPCHQPHTLPAAAIGIVADAMDLLPSFPPVLQRTTFILFDPPYLITTRTRLFYTHELTSPEQHARLLDMIQQLRCMVMICHYPNGQYDHALRTWHRHTYTHATRGGPKTEALYMNYPKPTALHDTRFAAQNYRTRQDLKRQIHRWTIKLQTMDPRKRQAIIEAVRNLTDPHGESADDGRAFGKPPPPLPEPSISFSPAKPTSKLPL